MYCEFLDNEVVWAWVFKLQLLFRKEEWFEKKLEEKGSYSLVVFKNKEGTLLECPSILHGRSSILLNALKANYFFDFI